MKRWLPLAVLLATGSAHAQPGKPHHPKRPHVTAEGPKAAKQEADKGVDAKPSVAVPSPSPPASPSVDPSAPTTAASPAAANPDVKVSTKVDKTELKVGELAKLQVVVDAPSSIEPSLPEQAFGGLELVDRRLKTEAVGGRTRTTFELDLLALNAGDANIPALDVRLVGQNGELSSARSDAQSLRVSSLIANEPNAEPKPLSKPLEVMADDYTIAWVALALLLVAIVALATLLIARWVKRRPKPVVPPPPPRPAWELARERLEQLAKQREPMFAADQGQEFVAGVSDALREYLGKRYGFDGLERTTHELLSILEKQRPHGLKLATVSTLLDECDLVKFARVAPSAEGAEQLWQGAMQLVQSTIPVGPPPAQAAVLPEVLR